SAGLRLKRGHGLRSFEDVFDRDGKIAREFLEATALERLEMIADDAGSEGLSRAELTKLDQQTFAQGPRANPRRVEFLELGEHGLDRGRLHAADCRDLFDRGAEIAVVVGVAGDQRGYPFLS